MTQFSIVRDLPAVKTMLSLPAVPPTARSLPWSWATATVTGRLAEALTPFTAGCHLVGQAFQPAGSEGRLESLPHETAVSTPKLPRR